MLVLLSLCSILLALSSARHQGFVGIYHAASGVVADGQNTSAFDVGEWGIVAPENCPSDGGFDFSADLEFHCKQKDINALYGMVLPPSERGVFNNTNDTDIFKPTAQGKLGMLQAAARWSALAQDFCPQVAGIVIDDFWSNYEGDAPQPIPGQCSQCPHDRTHLYGSFSAGFYCCTWPAAGHCKPPTGAPARSPCCLLPGVDSGCQSVQHCGNNPKEEVPCDSKSAGFSFNEMRDIKAALMGKTVSPEGIVDHSSVAATPYLKLFVVTYQEQVQRFKNQALVNDHIVDGISFWISGPSQRSMHSNLSAYIGHLRNLVGTTFPIFTGGYVTYSSIGWTQPAPFYDLINQSLSMYDSNAIQGFYLFAGSVLSKMSRSLWSEWDLPAYFDSTYQPWLGTVNIEVRDALTKEPVVNALVTVTYNTSTHVTRKRTSSSGVMRFGGWSGRHHPIPHTIQVTANGYPEATAVVMVERGQMVSTTVLMQSGGRHQARTQV